MDDQTLPERLRYLSTRFALSEYVAQTGDVLREAADELEQLDGLLYVAEREAPAKQPRRFAAHYPDGWRTPAPGSFVYAGPALAVWRVLAVDALAGHPNATHAIELEAVDAHDVPMLARVETVPDPVSELDPAMLYEAGEAVPDGG